MADGPKMLARRGMPFVMRNEMCRDLMEAKHALDRAVMKAERLVFLPLQPDECTEAEETLDDLIDLRNQVFELAGWVFPDEF